MTTQTIHVSNALSQRYEELLLWKNNPEKYRPVSSGLASIDTAIGGWPRYPFYGALVGTQKAGKTTIELNLTINFCAALGQKVGLYMLEENNRQVADRLFARWSHHTSRTDIFKLNLSDDDMMELQDTTAAYRNTEYYVNDNLSDINDILSDAQQNKFQHIVIDNFQLMTGGKGRDERTQLADMSRTLMRARQAGLTVFLISQGNDKGESFGTTQVRMDADIVIGIEFVRSNPFDKKSPLLPNMRRLRVQRSRFSAADTTCDIVFNAAHSRISDIPVPLTAEDILYMESEEMQ